MGRPERKVGIAVGPQQVHEWLLGKEEIALIDVREEGQFGLEHPLSAVNVPYSRLEADIVPRVPLRSTRIVIIDTADGIATRSIAILDKLGYASLHILEGGLAAWKAAGYRVFDGTNVPSKAFAEVVEIAAHTPHISPDALHRLKQSGRDFVLLDTRTPEEFSRFHVPGARSAPGVELQARIADLVPSPDTLIVVSCAGRTRSIIGAQGLINVGVPNQVVSLAGGTQGWRIAGFELETSPAEPLPERGAAATRLALERAEVLRAQHGIRIINRKELEGYAAEPVTRTTYAFDVRSREEFESGHLPGARWVPGGQLVQTLDAWVGVRNARLVLTDDDGVRATIAAHWLVQMGWEASVLVDVPGSGALEQGRSAPAAVAALPRIAHIASTDAVQWLGEEGRIVSTDQSGQFRSGHPRGAVWVNRTRLDRLDAAVLRAARILVVGDDEAVASLVAGDLQTTTGADVRLLSGGTWSWRAAGLPIVPSATPDDSERVDCLFWNHTRLGGDLDAMRAYLQWELDLPSRLAADDTASFTLESVAAGNRSSRRKEVAAQAL